MAGHLAGGIQAGDRRALYGEHLCLGRDVQTAHGVVHGWLAGHEVVRAVSDDVHLGAVAEIRILPVGAVLVPLLDGLLQLSGIDAFKREGIETIVFITNNEASTFKTADLLEKASGGSGEHF